ncbi:cocE, partial [Symbiodinium microadriaticum]
VYEVTFSLWNTSWVIPAGHALRFSVQSSNNPRFAVNPQNGILLADPKYPGDNVTAVNKVYHSAKYPSRVSLPVVHKYQLPKVHIMKEMQKAYPQLTQEMATKFHDGLMKHMKVKEGSTKQ